MLETRARLLFLSLAPEAAAEHAPSLAPRANVYTELLSTITYVVPDDIQNVLNALTHLLFSSCV